MFLISSMVKISKIKILLYSSEYWPFYDLIKVNLQKMGCEVDTYIYEQKNSPFKYLHELLYLKKTNYKKYDIIHAFFGTSAFIANIQRSVPVITTFCGSDLLGVLDKNGDYNVIKSYIFKVVSNIAYRLSKKTTTLSKKLQYQLPNEKKNSIIPLGIDTDHFKPLDMFKARSQLNWSASKIYILFPAEKNRLIKRFHIAKQVVDELSNDEEIVLVSLDEPNLYSRLPLIMSACNLMIFVSKHEGSPNVIREGLSCNLPIFSFDIGDVSEHLIDVKHSDIIFNENIKKMRKRIQNFLLKNPNARSNGRKKMVNLSWCNHAKSLIKLYEKNI